MRSRRFFIVSSVLALALFLFVSLPAALVLGPKKLRDYTYRELAYRVIADEVTKDAANEIQMAESLFTFVAAHEYKTNVNVIDSTVLDDLVRGIGWCDQKAWALSTLLAKKGIPSSILMLRGYDHESHHTVALVYLAGKWRFFDPFYHLLFVEPSGALATFDDLQRVDRRAMLRSLKHDAIRRYDSSFDDAYFKLFESKYEPVQWQPLTEKKRDPPRLLVSSVVDFYVKVLGERFARRFQDAYLARALRQAPDDELFARARHYDLFSRRDLALANYKRLLAGYPDSPHVQDALYFMGRLYEDLNQWVEAEETFDTLMARFGGNAKWAGLAHYFHGLASEAVGNVPRAVQEYQASASSTDQQVDWSVRLAGFGVPGTHTGAKIRAVARTSAPGKPRDLSPVRRIGKRGRFG